jgi:hypothetical protein
MSDDISTEPEPAPDAAPAEPERTVIPTTEHTIVPAVYGAICEAMNAIGVIGKGKTSDHGKFKFRGVDDAMNALAPVLRAHCLFISPRLVNVERTRLETKGGGGLMNTVVEVEYEFTSGADGSKHIVGPIPGEGMDTGDKSTAKAMSVALRTMLLQVFMIPTEDRDPDHDVYEVASTPGAPPVPNGTRRAQHGDFDPWADSNPDLVRYYRSAIEATTTEDALKLIWADIVDDVRAGKLAAVDGNDLKSTMQYRIAALRRQRQDTAAEAPQA